MDITTQAIVLYSYESFVPLTVVEVSSDFLKEMEKRGHFELPLWHPPSLKMTSGAPPDFLDRDFEVLLVTIEVLIRMGTRHLIFTIPDDTLARKGRVATRFLPGQKKEVAERVDTAFQTGRIQGLVESFQAYDSSNQWRH